MIPSGPKTSRIARLRACATVGHEECGSLGPKPSLEQVREQSPDYCGVLGRAFRQAQHVFPAVRRDPQRHHNGMVMKINAVNHDGMQVQPPKRPPEEIAQPLSRERDETA